MNRDSVYQLLVQVRTGELSIDEAMQKLRKLPYLDVADARIDTHRHLRQGFPEVIFGLSKSAEQIVTIARSMMESGQNVLVTKVDCEKVAAILERLPQFSYNPVARTLSLIQDSTKKGKGAVVVISAGTSDLPVVEEACETLQILGHQYTRLGDVGVAGLHRLLASLDVLYQARVAIVVAGMEGALPSVVGGLVSCPVIAVPTSVGYGASFNGITALLGMLNSCAANVTVVNIDNGFGAGFIAGLINDL